MRVLTSTLFGLFVGCALTVDIVDVAFHAKDPSHLYNVIRSNSDLDYGCRPVIMRFGDEHQLHALVSPAQLDRLKHTINAAQVHLDLSRNLQKRQDAVAPIGTGDRFMDGKIAPRGLGSRKPGESADLGPILNVDEVASAMKGLANRYKMPMFTTPYETYEKQRVMGGVANKAPKIEKDKQYVYLTSGIHARERGGPDNLIYFISDLLYANEHGTGLTYGDKTYTHSQVKKALGTGIVFIPLTNPDGVRYDQKNGNRWRKNRNPASAIPGNSQSIGVDLNRNFDFLWNYTLHFDPSVAPPPASNDPVSAAFYGTAPFSEPETRNMVWVYDQFPNIRWFIDVHSAAGTLLYSWGDDVNQAVDPQQNFFNPEYDGKRGVINDTLYGEYIDQEDWHKISFQANRTTAAMASAGGRSYAPQQAVGLYPTSGASDDYSFSRWHKNKSVNRVYGYTMEFGYPTNFYPTSEEYIQNIIDTNAGFMEFCLTADEIGLKD